MSKKYEFLTHTGDIKFKAYGFDIEDMFENCALAISHIFSRGAKISDGKEREFIISEKDYESMLYKFIEELIYLFDTDEFVVCRVEVGITGKEMKVTAYGDDASEYKDLDAIKSPTYAEMYVKQNKNKRWEAQVVVDV